MDVTFSRQRITKFKVGGIVMGCVAVQSKKSIQRVSKLVYQSKGLFVITKDTGNSTYLRNTWQHTSG